MITVFYKFQLLLIFPAKCAVPENTHTPPMEGFCFAPSLPPRNSSLASYFAFKILTLKTPLSLGISNDLPWGGYVGSYR